MSKAKFREICPTAVLERHRTNGHEVYYLVRQARGDFMPIADGKTEGEAWRNAWERLVPKLRAAVAPKATP